MCRDPFDPPAAALARPAGHLRSAPRSKKAGLTPFLGATGVPLGGIGTGGITRGSDGRIGRWTLKAGAVARFDMPSCGAVLRVAPEGRAPEARALQPAPGSGELAAFAFEAEAPAWAGLFPFAWHRHAPVGGVRATSLSFSPVIPGDLAAAALPVAVLRWRLTNEGDRPTDATVALHWPNLNGWFDRPEEERPGRVAAGCFNRAGAAPGSVVFDRRRPEGVPPEGTGTWALAIGGEGAALSRTLAFDGGGDGAAFWEGVLEDGDAPDLGPSWLTESGFRETAPPHPAGAVSARTRLAPGETREVTTTLAWDLPALTFGSGRRWLRAHADAWGREGRAAEALAAHALAEADEWIARLQHWQTGTIHALGDAPEGAGLALNELYFVVDGMSVLTSAEDAPHGRRHFGLIECPDYALYDTMDLWVYAAEAVGRHWPELAAAVAEDYADHLLADDPALRRHRWDGTPFRLNPSGISPHDLGGPGEDPFVTPNSYTYRDPTLWKDLNADFVLCVWREGQAMGAAWRRRLFPAVRAALERLEAFDSDGDGLIENDGTPDQTFDNIPMRGPSSYCGGLWLAALRAGVRLAEEAEACDVAARWAALAGRGAAAFTERLYTGAWFRVDTDGPLSAACFVEQLFGPFLARRLGLGDIVDEAHARTALRAIHAINFRDEGGGEGAVSLARVPDAARAALPHRADTSFQTAEIQPGFNFSLAAQLDAWGLGDEAADLRRALARELDRRNLSFQTPAAFDRGRDTARAVMNMRPLAAWWAAPFRAEAGQALASDRQRSTRPR